ncbi:MAG: hypothetical protein KAH14_02205, partial [Clostridiales bacterium]|nr:hypothetical protein [Clostridiales bacterium]
MKMSSLVEGATDKRIMRYGITDHIHTPFNYPDIINSKKAYDANCTENFYFGVEVSCVSQWELNTIASGAKGNLTYGIREGGPAGGALAIAIDEEYIAMHDIKYVVGGTHWAMYTENKAQDIINDYHRQNMFLSEHKLVDIIAHPWWYLGPCEDCWYTDFNMIPLSMHEEFAKSCIENAKLVEINLSAMLLSDKNTEKFKQEYLEYLVMLKEFGVEFSIGSDCHNEFYDINFQKASDMLETSGFTSYDFNPTTEKSPS